MSPDGPAWALRAQGAGDLVFLVTGSSHSPTLLSRPVPVLLGVCLLLTHAPQQHHGTYVSHGQHAGCQTRCCRTTHGHMAAWTVSSSPGYTLRTGTCGIVYKFCASPLWNCRTVLPGSAPSQLPPCGFRLLYLWPLCCSYTHVCRKWRLTVV